MNRIEVVVKQKEEYSKQSEHHEQKLVYQAQKCKSGCFHYDFIGLTENIRSRFSIRSYGKTQVTFLANPYLEISHGITSM